MLDLVITYLSFPSHGAESRHRCNSQHNVCWSTISSHASHKLKIVILHSVASQLASLSLSLMAALNGIDFLPCTRWLSEISRKLSPPALCVLAQIKKFHEIFSISIQIAKANSSTFRLWRETMREAKFPFMQISKSFSFEVGNANRGNPSSVHALEKKGSRNRKRRKSCFEWKLNLHF